MAKRFFQIFDSAGSPLTTATPTFVDYRSAATGTPRTAPANPVHVGNGLYSFASTDADEIAGTVALIDCGASANPRRFCYAIHQADNSNAFFAVHLENPDGTLWTGSAPTIGAYRDSTGASISPPTPLGLTTYLFTITPTVTDIGIGVGIWVQFPAGASSLGYSGQTVAKVVTAPLFNPTSLLTASTASTTAVPSCSDFAWDLQTGLPKLLNHDLQPLTQVQALAQRLWLRLTRIKGEHFLALDQGLPWLEFGNKPANLTLIRQQIIGQATDVLGVLEVNQCDLTLNPARQMTVNLSVQGADGVVTISV